MKEKLFIILMLSLFFISGCWDKAEIEQRTFVSDIGVDLNKKGEMNRFIVTYQYPNINAIGKNATEDKKSYVLSTPCSSIFQAGRELSTRVPFPFYYKHVKVLILGEELLHEENLVREVIDELNRDTKINKKVQILVAEGKAKDIIEANITREQTVDGVIYSTVKDNKTSSRFTSQTLTGLISNFDFSGVSLIPRVTIIDDRYVISGGCIMKNYKYVAWIDEKENRAISLLNNKVNNETMDVIYEGDLVSYTITNAKSTKKVEFNDEINVNFSIRTEGYIQGYIMDGEKTTFDNEVLEEMEKTIEKDIKKELDKTIDKLQKTYKADVIGVGEHISKFESKDWKKIKNNWDNIFPDININTTVDVKIRRTGLTK
ncbi:Ger(x)C family spore germination protein [Schnuerera sp.]|uniref:Ger(x)C family spore germination protein n=1 Tax=Schnuerera sp. TaxID=2794844 RepID=UPI002C558B98|nr:Ger(x)C family spore germination protein [Schnuerera sp.]HSH35562.1 Ger(x)C family spore germination protein [Schnuerera sp.]